MIIEFRVQNHRSFRREQTLSLVASNYDKSLEENVFAPDLPGLDNIRVVKSAALYGPNAGGKTNVILALRFLQWLVVGSATGQQPEAKLPVEPFRLDKESAAAPTMLQLTFIAESVRYELAVAVTGDRVVQERLVAYPNGRAQVWYDRVWNSESNEYEWTPAQPTDFERDPGVVQKTRGNALFLSTAAQWNNAQVVPIYRWFAEKLQFLNLSAESPMSPEFTARLVNRSEHARAWVTRLLRSADFGVANVEVTEHDWEPGLQKFFASMKDRARASGAPTPPFPDRALHVAFQHEGKAGERFGLNWAAQSAGTRRFFSLLGPWLHVAQHAQVLCVDELDTSLHPNLVTELLRLLFHSTQNKPGAQLLFTTHNPLLLDQKLLRRDQIWFADKNKEGESFLYPLTQYKPRVDESLVRGYLSGRYGAVPYLPDEVFQRIPLPDEEESGEPEAVHGG